MKYYNTLSIDMKIQFKNLFKSMEPFNLLFIVLPLNRAIDEIVNKLIMEEILPPSFTAD